MSKLADHVIVCGRGVVMCCKLCGHAVHLSDSTAKGVREHGINPDTVPVDIICLPCALQNRVYDKPMLGPSKSQIKDMLSVGCTQQQIDLLQAMIKAHNEHIRKRPGK